MDSTDFRALYVRRNSTKWCEWQLVQWWQWNVHLTPLLIWKLLTNHHWVVAWLLLDANCPVLLPRGGISLKGLTAQWLQQFASCTELCKYPFVQWCHEAMNQSFNPQHLARDKFPNAQIYSRVHVYIRTYVCLYPASVVYVRAYSMPQYKVNFVFTERSYYQITSSLAWTAEPQGKTGYYTKLHNNVHSYCSLQFGVPNSQAPP